MKKETPHSEKRGAYLADGVADSGARQRMPTTGRDQGEAQSEREKRGLRHSELGVASSSRSFGVVTPPDGHFSAARLRPARSRKASGQPGHEAGAVVLCLLTTLSNQQNWFNNY